MIKPVLDPFQIREQWDTLDQIARIPNEARSARQWADLRLALSNLGYAVPTRPVSHHARHWSVTVCRAGEGYMHAGHGKTLDAAWRVAVAQGYATIWRCDDAARGVMTPFVVWEGLFHRAMNLIRVRGNARCTRASCEHMGCSVDVELIS